MDSAPDRACWKSLFCREIGEFRVKDSGIEAGYMKYNPTIFPDFAAGIPGLQQNTDFLTGS